MEGLPAKDETLEEDIEQSPSVTQPISFKPGGVLEHLGGMSAHFGDVEIQIIASPDNPDVGFITGLKGENTSSVIDEIANAIKMAGFRSVEYRADNEDGRAAARERLFKYLKKKVLAL